MAFISDVQIQYNNITIPPEAIEALGQFKSGLLNVSELCLRLGEYGMQIVRFNTENVTLYGTEARRLRSNSIFHSGDLT